MELLPWRGEAESNKRRLEVEVEPVPPFNEESNYSFTIKEEDIRKGEYGQLEKRPKLDVTPDVVEDAPNDVHKENILDIYPELKGYVVFPDSGEEEEDFCETKYNWKSEDYDILKDFITEEHEGRQLNILRRAARFCRADYSDDDEEEGEEGEFFFGAEVIASWFDDYDDTSPDEFLSKFNLDAKTLESHMRKTSKSLGIPDWENLAKYIKQLKESEGFDLDVHVYKNLSNTEYTEYLPKRLSKKEMRGTYRARVLDECMKAAMEFYDDAGGGKLEEAKLIKANELGGSRYDHYYMTFAAKSSLDGKERKYQAIVVYDGCWEDGEPGVDKRRIMVRLKKEGKVGMDTYLGL